MKRIFLLVFAGVFLVSCAGQGELYETPGRIAVVPEPTHTATLQPVIEEAKSGEKEKAVAQKKPVETAPSAAATAVPAVKKAKPKRDDSPDFYPLAVGNTWYYEGYKKIAPDTMVQAKGEIIRIEEKDGIEYYYAYSPKVNIRYLVRKDEWGAYMRVIRYPFPVFGFSIDVDIVPEMPFIKFPLKEGTKWTHRAKAKTWVLFLYIERSIHVDFEVAGKTIIKTDAGDLEAWHIKATVDEGDGKAALDEYWYARGVGYARADASGHYAQVVGYKIYDEKTGAVREKAPPLEVEKYE
ncbi:MAG TPA: hypothetical protein ENN43_00800 [bacterium]|nr:hypothetical protein [bacterium]